MNKELLNHGAVSWTELSTSDPDAARKFYSELFGWDYQEFSMPDMAYYVVKNGGREIGGIMKTPPEAKGMPPFWMSYITVDNVDDTAEKAESLGAKIVLAPRDIPEVGRMCVFVDPQGATLAAITYLKKD